MNTADFLKQMDEQRRLAKQVQWEGVFADYLEAVAKDPKVASLAHARLYEMVAADGMIERGDDLPKDYKFFTTELYGMDRTLQHLVEEYLAPAAKRLDVRKRILLLVGPVGGGKSTLVTMLKRGLEKFSKAESGAVYAIKDCPMHEEPLHLVPEELRAEFKKRYGVHIEGDLCPVCRWRMSHEWGDNFESVPVVRILLSERDRVGVGTFKPSDPKSQDVSELTGSVNLNLLTQIGVESDPRVYNFDGELNKANRGIMEFIEMLKADKRFLYELNTVAGEQMIKIGRFSLIYTDTVVVAHTNEYEFNSYFSNKENEAMIDRMFVVKVPYNLQVGQEVRIYDKLIHQSQWNDETNELAKVHIAPHALRSAAMFAIMSRLKPPKKSGMSLLTKMKLYDGERQVGDWDQRHVKELREEYGDEGMNGVSPRFILNRLSASMVTSKACITPIDVLRSLRDGLVEHTSSEEERKKLLTMLDDARKEYDELIKKEVQRFFVYSYEEAAKTLVENYLDNVDAYCNKTKVNDPITDEELDPDEKLMRSIEEQIGVSDNAKREFREGVLRSVASLARRGARFEIGSDERLREAIERKLFADLKDIVKITTSAKTPDPDQLRKINDVVNRMAEEGGYCATCANEALRYVGTLLNR
ncbi:MAG: protein prkA [Armatimonadetes bacterium]|nr:protein prkA [Armatimonadota bacterium]